MSIMHTIVRKCYFCKKETTFQTNMIPLGPPMMLSTEPPEGWRIVGSVLCCDDHRSIRIIIDGKEYTIK